MTEIIKKYERFDWARKLNSFTSAAEAKKWQIKEYRRSAEDKEYWFKQYVWTMDPRKTPAIVPFMLYDFQIRLIRQLDKFMDTFIDKSRQMGISWSVMGWELHNVLYTEGFNALNISRKESEVQDAGNTFNALFGRILFMYKRLPPYLAPTMHNPFLTFQVPRMNSVIKGESSNPKAGRDSQYKFILIDEGAHIECLDEMWKGCRSASNSICLNSTPPKSKVNNKFAEIKDMKNSGFKHMRFHWREHPDYDDAWFAKKTASMTDSEIAQELEVKYDAALVDKSYAEYKDDIHLMSRKIWLNPKSKLYCFMDFGLSGEVFLFAQKDFEDRLFFIYYKIYYDMLTPELYQEMLKCLAHLKYLRPIEDIEFIGDKSGNKRDRTSKISVIDEYRHVSKNKIHIRSKEISNEEKMKDMKTCLKNRINDRPQFNISNEPTCLEMAEAFRCLQLNKHKTDHVDNKYTHVVNAAEYGITYLFPRKKAEFFVISLDPGKEFIDNEGKTKVFENERTKAVSATAVIGSHRINKKGVIFR